MPEIPRTKFNSPWTVAVIEAALNDVSSAKGSSESLTAALNDMRAEINSLSGGVHLKGAVDYYNDLPASPSEGDAYTVRYQGTSGTDPLGIEYAWATYQGTPQWIPIGVDPSVYAKQTEMDVVASMGAVSLVPVTAVSGTAGGVEYTVNDDGTVVANRVSSSSTSTWFRLNSAVSLKKGTYTLSGGKSANERVLLSPTTTLSDAIADSQGSEVTFTLDADTDNLIFAIRIAYTDSPSNVKFYPMIKPAAITDPSFQPYARTNSELTVLTDEDRDALVELVNGGAKNVLKTYNVSSTTTGNVTYSVSGGVVTVSISGTQSTAKVLLYAMDSDVGTTTVDSRNTIPKGTYILRTTGNGKVKLRAYEHDGTTATLLAETTGADAEFTYSGTQPYVTFTLSVSSNTSLSEPLTFMPMCCLKSLYAVDSTAEPYCPSMHELYQMILELQSGGNRALTMQTEPEESEER